MCDKVQNVNIHEGEWGTVGSVISWNFIHDGKEKVAKDIVESKGDQNNLVTWIIEYEKKNANVPNPHTYMEFVLNMSKDIETHHDLTGKLISEIEIKSDGNVCHEIFRYRPHHISSLCPDKIQNMDIHEGEWGIVGSIIFCNSTLDGKEKVSKHIVEAIDEEKKLIKFKVIEGDILEEYISFTVHVESKGENNLVTWIIEYEKKNANVPDPHIYGTCSQYVQRY
ncbi:hypothetical protein H5410_019675 [Solanum commersonii]|uniref:Bet v I/Major latex protein domain-containing protein n=1 Tax=Solanum commersonii TaxID=4109 RepID=A0A9J5Z6Z0_SOLCO|nr:hypothetical protein H5410_019675 [Solanum commersonii]